MNRSDERKETSAGMAREPAESRRDTAREQTAQRADQEGDESDVVKSGRGIGVKSVEAEHVMGDEGDSIRTATAEGEPDMASASANRKEAMEPEREEDEKAAIGKDRTVAHKNAMGWGEREVEAKHTI